jgi:hypothetical protein
MCQHSRPLVGVKTLMSLTMCVDLGPQATDAILDFALLAGKPFAIIPCCVFGRQFPDRRVLWPGPSELAPASNPRPGFPNRQNPESLPDLEQQSSSPRAHMPKCPAKPAMPGALLDCITSASPSPSHAEASSRTAGGDVSQNVQAKGLLRKSGLNGSHGSVASGVEPSDVSPGLPPSAGKEGVAKHIEVPREGPGGADASGPPSEPQIRPVWQGAARESVTSDFKFMGEAGGYPAESAWLSPEAGITSHVQQGGREQAGPLEENRGSPTARKENFTEGGKSLRKAEGEVVGKGQDASRLVWQGKLGLSRACVNADTEGLSRVPVVSHAQLVEYLMQRGGEGTRVLHLPFEGLNQVVYCHVTSQQT